jgi:hypothetical protein
VTVTVTTEGLQKSAVVAGSDMVTAIAGVVGCKISFAVVNIEHPMLNSARYASQLDPN